MSEISEKIVIKKSYLKPGIPFPYCKACGHRHVLMNLDEALVKLNLRKEQINITSDLGCVGLINDLLQDVHTVQTTYGRSTAFATGTAIADQVLFDGKIKTIVMIGDGGALAGLNYLVQAARMNVDITVLINNNFLYGMTGGQSSGNSIPPVRSSVSKRSPDLYPSASGNLPPVDFIHILEASHAGFLARSMATDIHLSEMIAQAIEFKGFSLVEIFELCSFLEDQPNQNPNVVLKNMVDRYQYPMGIIMNQPNRTEYSASYQQQVQKIRQANQETKDDFIHKIYENNLTKPLTIFIAGTVDEQLPQVAEAFALSAVKSGLSIIKRDDRLSPQVRASQVAKICISPEPMYYAGLETPDVVIISSESGLREALQQKVIHQMKEDSWLILDDQLSLPEILKTKKIKTIIRPFRKEAGENYALVCALGFLLKRRTIFPEDAFRENWGNELEVQNKLYLNALEKGMQMSLE